MSLEKKKGKGTGRDGGGKKTRKEEKKKDTSVAVVSKPTKADQSLTHIPAPIWVLVINKTWLK